MKYYLSIDAGTSVIKTVIFSQDFKMKFKSSIENKVQTNSSILKGRGYELFPMVFSYHI